MQEKIQFITDTIRSSSAKVAKEKNLDLIIEETTAFFLNKNNSNIIDVTDEVIETFFKNKEINKFIEENK